MSRRPGLAGPGLRRCARRLAGGLAGAALITGCASSHPSSSPPANTVPSSSSGTLQISPAHPAARTSVSFAFAAPVASGVHGHRQIDYSLSVTGIGKPGCVGAHEAGVAAAGGGVRARVSLGLAQLHRPWCPGRYTARAIELQRAHCTGSAPCPQYVRVVAIVARGTFTVRRG